MSSTSHAPLNSSEYAQQSTVDETREPASPWLWVALIVALFIAAFMWLQYNRNGLPIAPPVGERSLPAPEAVPAAAPSATPARPVATAPTQRKAAPVVRNRDARPLASNAEPRYPASALRAGVEGGVVARLNVDRQGQVSDVTIVERNGTRDRALDRAVVTAAKQWRFEPAQRDGKAVASVVQVPVDFRTASR